MNNENNAATVTFTVIDTGDVYATNTTLENVSVDEMMQAVLPAAVTAVFTAKTDALAKNPSGPKEPDAALGADILTVVMRALIALTSNKKAASEEAQV